MKTPNANVHLNGFVIDHGTRGQCFGCQSFLYETTHVSSQIYCRSCFTVKFPNNSTAKFEKSDAKFCCPKKCGARNLSFDQFIIGDCCETASRWVGSLTFYKISILNRLYVDSRNEEGDAETRVVTADKTVETCRQALEDAEYKAKNARDELDEKKKWRRKIQTRTLFMTSIEMKQDNADIENRDQNSHQQNDTNKETCTVCFDIYAEDERQKSVIIPCGHQACFGCLSSLQQKCCPTCRAEFTDDKVFKLYPSTQN
ncbi:unnamed protein product [Oikopleura dioica]|uniref:RING-type domain-containing protein n=1 Tax=Oikopleura dioica TaxID=34765 RepID=E4XXM4_OIKDI|nr:unnamed protein product [Oikopleura dioica]